MSQGPDALLPCPFHVNGLYEHKLKVTRHTDGGTYAIRCDCGARGPWGADPKHAGVEWNARRPPSPLGGEPARLRALLNSADGLAAAYGPLFRFVGAGIAEGAPVARDILTALDELLFGDAPSAPAPVPGGEALARALELLNSRPAMVAPGSYGQAWSDEVEAWLAALAAAPIPAEQREVGATSIAGAPGVKEKG